MNKLNRICILMVTWVVLSLSSVSIASAESGKSEKGLQKATFAGGCFWCMEPPFEKLTGVSSVVSGYTGARRSTQATVKWLVGKPGTLRRCKLPTIHG